MLKKSLVLGWAVALSFLFLSSKTGQPQEGPVPPAERFVHYGAGNPYLPLWEHLPDGEPRVFEDPDNPGKFRAYIIGSHDLRFASYCGPDIRVWSAPVEDLSQWRDEGPVFTYEIEGKWDVMYAPDLVEVKRKDGTKEYYLYPDRKSTRLNSSHVRISYAVFCLKKKKKKYTQIKRSRKSERLPMMPECAA